MKTWKFGFFGRCLVGTLSVVLAGLGKTLKKHGCEVQRNLASRLHSEVASLTAKLEENEAAWNARCDGLRRALEAQEGHSAALETELAARPTSRQVSTLPHN
jgi:hypothetical protein